MSRDCTTARLRPQAGPAARLAGSVLATLVAGCGSAPTRPPAAPPVPRLERLEERVQAVAAAWVAGDAATLYATMSPRPAGSQYTPEAFRRDFGLDQARPPGPALRGARLEAICSCGPAPAAQGAAAGSPRDLRCVLAVAADLETAPGRSRTARSWAMWEYVAGEWYWGYPGDEGPEGPPCPGRQPPLWVAQPKRP